MMNSKSLILRIATVLFLATLLFNCSSPSSKKELADYVNPIIGTDWHGHTFPGPVLPLGMIQPGPDTGSDGWDIISGYALNVYNAEGKLMDSFTVIK